MAPSHPRLKARTAKQKKGFSNDVPPGLHYLLPLDPKSKEFLDLFRSFLLSKDERMTILALSEEDAKVFIQIIDRAFRTVRLDAELKTIAFCVLKKLCGRIGHLPDSYLLSDKFDSGAPHASGGFSDLRKGTFKGRDVAVKSLRISQSDGKIQIRKRFCKDVAMWKNLSHPNVLNLIGVPDTLEEGRFSMVSEWMPNGNITEYARANAGNHLKLLEGAVEGLAYLHRANIVHGDLKGANILIANAHPVSACLVDFGFMSIVHDPTLGMEAAKVEVDGGTTNFMAPERLVPSKFGLERGAPTMEADIYGMAMVIYQVLTGELPFGKRTGPEVVFKVLGGVRPTKPTNALKLGLFDNVWELLEGCWRTERQLRPSVRDVLGCIKSAASTCGTLPPVGGVAQRHADPDSLFNKFDQLFLGMIPDDPEDIRSCSMERPLSQESDTSSLYSLFSKLSEASEGETFITEFSLVNVVPLVQGGQSTEELPAFLFGRGPDHGSHPGDPISRSSTPSSGISTRQRLFRSNSGPYRNEMFAESSGSDQTLLSAAAPHQRDQPGSDTAVSSDGKSRIEKPLVADPVTTSYHFVLDTTAIGLARTRDNSTRQPRKPPNEDAKNKARKSRFHIRQRLGRVLDRIANHPK